MICPEITVQIRQFEQYTIEKFARWQFMVTTALLLIILGFVIANSSRLSPLEARFGEFDRRLSVIEQRLSGKHK